MKKKGVPHNYTNGQVKKALDQCIELRWKVIVSQQGRLGDVPYCQLCDLFLNLRGGCAMCPLGVYEKLTKPGINADNGCLSGGATYQRWCNASDGRSRTKAARNMLRVLEETRTYFFGEGLAKLEHKHPAA